jgi:hypothetical protein
MNPDSSGRSHNTKNLSEFRVQSSEFSEEKSLEIKLFFKIIYKYSKQLW